MLEPGAHPGGAKSDPPHPAQRHSGYLIHDGGPDAIVSSATDTVLPDHDRNLELTGTASSGEGNASANRLFGNDADNVLLGMAGDDTLYGGGGDDTLIGGPGSDGYVYLAGRRQRRHRSTTARASDVDELILAGGIGPRRDFPLPAGARAPTISSSCSRAAAHPDQGFRRRPPPASSASSSTMRRRGRAMICNDSQRPHRFATIRTSCRRTIISSSGPSSRAPPRQCLSLCLRRAARRARTPVRSRAPELPPGTTMTRVPRTILHTILQTILAASPCCRPSPGSASRTAPAGSSEPARQTAIRAIWRFEFSCRRPYTAEEGSIGHERLPQGWSQWPA